MHGRGRYDALQMGTHPLPDMMALLGPRMIYGIEWLVIGISPELRYSK